MFVIFFCFDLFRAGDFQASPCHGDVTIDLGTFADVTSRRRLIIIILFLNRFKNLKNMLPLRSLGWCNEFIRKRKVRLIFNPRNVADATSSLGIHLLCRCNEYDYGRMAWQRPENGALSIR